MKMLESLILEGKDLEGLDAEELYSYEKWVSKCIIYLGNKYPKQLITKRFFEASYKKSIENHAIMMGTLIALKEVQEKESLIVENPSNPIKKIIRFIVEKLKKNVTLKRIAITLFVIFLLIDGFLIMNYSNSELNNFILLKLSTVFMEISLLLNLLVIISTDNKGSNEELY